MDWETRRLPVAIPISVSCERIDSESFPDVPTILAVSLMGIQAWNTDAKTIEDCKVGKGTTARQSYEIPNFMPYMC